MSVKSTVARTRLERGDVDRAGEELFNLVEVFVAVTGVDQVVLALQLDQLGVWDVLREIPCVRWTGRVADP